MWVLQPPVPPAVSRTHARQRMQCRTAPPASHRARHIHTFCMKSPPKQGQPLNARALRKHLLQGAPPIVQWWDAASLLARPGSKQRVSLPCTVMVEGMADAHAVSQAVVPEVGIVVVCTNYLAHTSKHLVAGRNYHHGRRHTRWHACVSHMACLARCRPRPCTCATLGVAA